MGDAAYGWVLCVPLRFPRFCFCFRSHFNLRLVKRIAVRLFARNWPLWDCFMKVRTLQFCCFHALNILHLFARKHPGAIVNVSETYWYWKRYMFPIFGPPAPWPVPELLGRAAVKLIAAVSKALPRRQPPQNLETWKASIGNVQRFRKHFQFFRDVFKQTMILSSVQYPFAHLQFTTTQAKWAVLLSWQN